VKSILAQYFFLNNGDTPRITSVLMTTKEERKTRFIRKLKVAYDKHSLSKLLKMVQCHILSARTDLCVHCKYSDIGRELQKIAIMATCASHKICAVCGDYDEMNMVQMGTEGCDHYLCNSCYTNESGMCERWKCSHFVCPVCDVHDGYCSVKCRDTDATI